MFDLAKCDTFHEGDIIVSFKKDDNETKAKIIGTLNALGFHQWAYSLRGDYEQYLFVADYEKRKQDHLNSCMNSLSLLPTAVKQKLSELVV